jgi:hypothetical protein
LEKRRSSLQACCAQLNDPHRKLFNLRSTHQVQHGAEHIQHSPERFGEPVLPPGSVHLSAPDILADRYHTDEVKALFEAAGSTRWMT